jgi:hypothetical protein
MEVLDMTVTIAPPETDVFAPRLPADSDLSPYLLSTYYFSFCVPEIGMNVYVYLRAQYALGLSQGGVIAFSGTDNLSFLDVDYHDYRATMGWPRTEGSRIVIPNGLTIDVIEPGVRLGLRYRSPDGAMEFDIEQRAVTPLVTRHRTVVDATAESGARAPGGTEQIMRCTGELLIRGRRHAVDSFALRDRSLFQVREEPPEGSPAGMPPLGWSTVVFGDTAFTQMGHESPEDDPVWAGMPGIDPERAQASHGWVSRAGEVAELTSARRIVHERHPVLHAPLRQTLEAEDANGRSYRFEGEAVAMAPIFCWPHIEIRDCLYRWRDGDGNEMLSDYQEGWYAAFQRGMKARRSS